MNGLATELDQRGLSIIAINVDSDPAAARKFLAAHPASFPILFDPQGKYAELLDVDVMPSSFLFNRDGQMVHRQRGFRTEDADTYRARIEFELEEKQKSNETNHPTATR